MITAMSNLDQSVTVLNESVPIRRKPSHDVQSQTIDKLDTCTTKPNDTQAHDLTYPAVSTSNRFTPFNTLEEKSFESNENMHDSSYYGNARKDIVEKFITFVHDKWHEIPIIISDAIPRGDYSLMNKRLQECNIHLRHKYIGNKLISVCDNACIGIGGNAINKFISSDKVHLSTQGTKVLVANIKSPVREALCIPNPFKKKYESHVRIELVSTMQGTQIKTESTQINPEYSDPNREYSDPNRQYSRYNSQNNNENEFYGRNGGYRNHEHLNTNGGDNREIAFIPISDKNNKNAVEEQIKVSEKGFDSLGRSIKRKSYCINIYFTTSSVLVNGKGLNTFCETDLPVIVVKMKECQFNRKDVNLNELNKIFEEVILMEKQGKEDCNNNSVKDLNKTEPLNSGGTCTIQISSSDNNTIKSIKDDVSSNTDREPSTSSVATTTDTPDDIQAKIKDINPTNSNDNSTCSDEIGDKLSQLYAKLHYNSKQINYCCNTFKRQS
ncbi:unnamed protein product [Mytilus coruscus]|uniref:Uncharacterized protein n=1 Tax=Mytilus coruscus TaxID=42192 RepID=A0A6J8CE95_MYTCO|nr:unnamed protein product [Mytilus coruscus]